MCSVWNSPSYQELERLFPLLRRDELRLYRAVVGMYQYPHFVRRAYCPRCRHVAPPGYVGELHTHHGKVSVLVARMVREPLYPGRAGRARRRRGVAGRLLAGRSVRAGRALLPLVA